MLELNNVTKVYRKGGRSVRALQNACLRLNRGGLAILQGASGCGKTTLLLSAGGLLAPDEGTIKLNDCELYALSSDERARKRAENIGFVFQQFHLIPYLSVNENIQSPLLAGESAVAAGSADELLERFGLSERRDHLPGELSSGEKQRVALARAMFRHPPLLLADEPTGNLDGANATIVLAALERYAQEGGAVLVVSHDERALKYGKQIFRMEAGVVSEVEM